MAGAPGESAEDATGHEGHDTDDRSTAARDRAFAKRIGQAALAWALIWTVIIAALFLFGDAISALVV